jgi:hypothetical protein
MCAIEEWCFPRASALRRVASWRNTAPREISPPESGTQARQHAPAPLTGAGEGGGERLACPPHPDLPPRRGKATFGSPLCVSPCRVVRFSGCGPDFETGVPLVEETMFTQSRSFALKAASVVLGMAFIVAITPEVTAIAITGQVSGTPVGSFERVATYDVSGQVAEIIAPTSDGETLIYTDSASQEIGFVSITDPRHPTSGGSLGMPGEPTSVAVTPDDTRCGADGVGRAVSHRP